MPRFLVFMIASTFLLLTLPACETTPETTSGKAAIVSESDATIAKAQRSDPSLARFMNGSAGYAVFPSIGKGAVGVGGAYGKGVVYEKGKAEGYCDMSQGSIGLALGGQSYTEIICFETKDDLKRFKQGKFAFDAQATAVALKSGAGANAKFANGVAVFTMDEAGLMFEASLGGQQFTYAPM